MRFKVDWILERVRDVIRDFTGDTPVTHGTCPIRIRMAIAHDKEPVGPIDQTSIGSLPLGPVFCATVIDGSAGLVPRLALEPLDIAGGTVVSKILNLS